LSPSSMIVDDFNITWARLIIRPLEADTPLLVDTD